MPIVAAIAANPDAVDDAPLRGRFDPLAQERAVKRVVAGLLLADGTWRIDPTAHPFATSISHGDVRLTTKYDADRLSYALYSSIHEAGHGIYESGIPQELRRGPLGRPPSLGFHESQSRLWENWVGRSGPFAASLLPILREEMPGRFDEVDPEALRRASCKAGPSPIRVEADEVTYNLHIALRFELELALFEGALEPAELPEAWTELTRSYLGIEPSGVAEGVLQDVHWAAGAFGYFPTYSLGNLIAAQLWELAADDDPALTTETSLGRFAATRVACGEAAPPRRDDAASGARRPCARGADRGRAAAEAPPGQIRRALRIHLASARPYASDQTRPRRTVAVDIADVSKLDVEPGELGEDGRMGHPQGA